MRPTRLLWRLCGAFKTRDEVGQAFTLDQDMVLEQPIRLVAVTGPNGVDDALMLGQRIRHSAARSQLQPAIWLQTIMKLACLFRQKGVLTGLVDDVVKALVGVVVGIRVLVRMLRGAIMMRRLELPLQRLGDRVGPPGRRTSLQARP